MALALVLASGPDARAGDDVAARRQAAQDLADSAFDLLQKGRYAAAAELFEKADATFHSPVFDVFRAQALEKQGKLLEARRLLQKVMDEKLAEYAPSAFRDAQKRAADRAAALDERIPTVTIQLEGAQTGDRVTLDGEPVAASKVGSPIQVEPGRYDVVAIRDSSLQDGGRRDATRVEVEEGDRVVAALDLTEPRGEPLETDAPEPEDDANEEGGGVPSWVWPTVAYGVGGVGLIMGAAAGGVFLSKQSALKDACDGDGDGDPNTCPPDQQSEGDSVKTLGNVATAGWVIAGLGAAVGTVLLFVPLGEEEATEDGVSARLVIGPTWLGLGGHF